MAKLHIIGVGGTGHKIVSACVHLTACGAFAGSVGKHEINEIRVLTIDADNANGNLTQTKTALAAYRDYFNAVNGADGLGLVHIEPICENINIPLFKEDKKSVNTAFNIPQYAGKKDDIFIRFLYTDNEIEAEFDQGFYGHTSIGTLIVKDILKSSGDWEKQLSQINENDFVFVAGSIFGGTGASAIPVLLDELNAKQREANFRLAVLMLNPYFTTEGDIDDGGLLRPDASNFNVKAKASLYYYYSQERYKKTNALYIIGEPESNFSVEMAFRGAANQRNKAAPIELFAATALIDFIRESKDREDGKIITAQRAEGGGSALYTWQMLGDVLPGLPVNIQTAVKAAIFYNKVLYPQLKHGNAAGVWQKYYDNDLDKKEDDNHHLVYENIHEYLKLLVRWFYDTHKRNRREVNQNSGALVWDADTRVKLFNANYGKLFDDAPAPDAVIGDFENLVYRDANPKKSEKIYAALCARPPASGGGGKSFQALFTALYACLREQKKGFLEFGKKPPEPETFNLVPYLSRENNVSFVKPDDPGKLWSKSEPTLLANIADALPSAVSKSFTKNDLSIPSPWSIFIMNELTLTGQKFAAINKSAFREWCGVIALLVLRKLNRYENAGLALETLELGGGDGEFLRVAEDTLKPESFVFDNPNWIRCFRLSLDGVTVAFLAHNTLVCPAYSLDIVTKGKLNKIAPTIVDENGDFLGPENYFRDQSQTLNRDAKYALRLFLLELKAIITREAAKNKSRIIKSLQDLTDAYIAALGAVTPSENLSIAPEKKNGVDSVYGLFEQLILSPSARNIELPFIMEGAATQAALIGSSICGISAHSAEAAHHLITANLLFNQITLANIGEYKNTTRDGVKLVYADELLLDSMVMIKKDGADVFYSRPNSGGLSDYEIIWPLNESLLELYPPETLNKMVSVSGDMEKITVSLKIPLGGKFGFHTASREYRVKIAGETREDEKQLNGVCRVMEKEYIPFWSLWPYAKINDAKENNTWRRYNCFCIEPNYRGIPVLDIKPVFPDADNYLAGERSLSTLQTALSLITHQFYYRRYTALPTAFRVSEKTEGAPVPRGLVFLADPKTARAGTLRWNVGVDFGTTSTTAFYTSSVDGTPRFMQLMSEYQWKEGNAEPKKFEFDNDLKTLCGGKTGITPDIYFIDGQCFRQNGYITALEIMDTSAASSDATVFTGERVFWHNYMNFKIMNSQEGRKERLLTNIKWESNKSNSAKYLNQLLTHIVYHAAEKGVRALNFFFSYPTSFGPGAKDDFCARLSGIIKLLAEETGIALSFNERHSLVTESIAAAYYFNHKKPRQTVFFCVDIGGGSTDASIWVKTKHLFQTSIHFASRDMFIRPLSRLVHIPSVLKAITTEEINDGIYTMLSDVSSGRDLTDDKFKFLIETVLFEYYAPLINRLQNMEGSDREAFGIFKYCVLITYSGLVYYLANIIASLFVSPDEARRVDNDIGEIILGLSGKGSKLTDWIKSYCDIIYGEAENLVKEKTSLDVRIIPEFSPETAKTETAIGMICNLDGDGRQKNQALITRPDVYMGCEVTVARGNEKRTLRGGDFADVYGDQFFAAPRELTVDFDKELGELDSFVAFFNRITAKTGNEMQPIDLDSYRAYKKSLWQKTRQEAENTLGEGRFEPPFIVLLKVFLEEYAEEYLWKKIA